MAEQDIALLHRLAREGSQEAFARLVRRHLDWVYSMSARLVRDKDLAEDVTQGVFILLARKAGSIGEGVKVTGFLFRACRYCAMNALKSERARVRREAKAAAVKSEIVEATEPPMWSELEAMLDEGVNRLSTRDREAILLRFYERRSLREVGYAVGISEDAAKKRVTRAVDRLREFFKSRGAVMPASALGELLFQNVVSRAPAKLGAAITGTTATTAGAAGTIAKGAAMAIAIKKTSSIVVAVVLLLVASAATVTVKSLFSSSSVKPSLPTVATSASPQTESPFHHRFADGSETEILAVGRDVRGKNEWWLPDGTPLTRPPFSNKIDYEDGPLANVSPQRISEGMLVLITNVRVPARKAPGPSSYFSESYFSPSPPYRLNFTATSFPPSWEGKQIVNPPYPEIYYYPQLPSQVVHHVALANGPWELAARYPGEQASNILNAKFSAPTREDGNEVLSVSFDNYDSNEMKLVPQAVLKDKRRLDAEIESVPVSKGTSLKLRVLVEPGMVDHYELFASPWQRVKFPPFATRPADRAAVDPASVMKFKVVKGE